MHNRGEAGHKNDLKERRADHHLGRHAKDIDHSRNQNKSAPHAHDPGQKAHQRAHAQRRQHRDIKPRGAELHLQRQPMHPRMDMGAANGGRPAMAAGAQQGARAFKEHHRADQAQKQHIGQLHKEIDLPKLGHPGKYPDPDPRAEKAPDQQHRPHAEIDGLAFQLRQHAGNRRGHHLIGPGRHRNPGRNADEQQEGRDQKPAAHTEHARQKAHDSANPEKQEGVDRDLGDGEVQLEHQGMLERGLLSKTCARFAGLSNPDRDGG